MWLDVGTRGCYEMFRLEPGHAHMDLVRVPGKRLIAGSWMTWGKRQEQPRLPELAAPSWPVHHYILNYDWLHWILGVFQVGANRGSSCSVGRSSRSSSFPAFWHRLCLGPEQHNQQTETRNRANHPLVSRGSLDCA
jgi:hypothetical protein